MSNEDKNIIVKFINGEPLDVSRESCAKWISEDQERVSFYTNMLRSDAIIGGSSHIAERRIDELLQGFALRKGRSKNILPLMKRIAQYAAILAVVVATAFYMSNEYVSVRESYNIDELYANYISTSAGETRTVELPDGTMVKLNANSSLAYADNFDCSKRRLVLLDGEGFFDVAKDTKRPFVVNVKGMQVKVLGTVFNVNGYNNSSIRTTLVSGKVEVNNYRGELISTLRPGTELIYNNNSKTLVSLNSVDAIEKTSWSAGYVKCRNMSLQELKPILENAYNAEVQFASSDVSMVEVSGRVYLDTPVEDLAHSLENTFELNIQISNSELENEKILIRIE